MDLPLSPRIRATGAPPIPAVRGWAARYQGGAGPVLDLTQAVPGYPPHPELLARLAAAREVAAEFHAGVDHGDQQQQAGIGKGHVGQAHDHGVQSTAVVARQEAHERADREGDYPGKNAHLERETRAMQYPCRHVTPEDVGPERVPERWRLERTFTGPFGRRRRGRARGQQQGRCAAGKDRVLHQSRLSSRPPANSAAPARTSSATWVSIICAKSWRGK